MVKDCIQYLRSTGQFGHTRVSAIFDFHADAVLGLRDEGLFRRSPNSVLLKQAAQAYDRGASTLLSTSHICTGVLTTPVRRSRCIPRDIW